MSKRHIFRSSENLVDNALRGVIAYNPSVTLDQVHRFVYDSRYDGSTVSIISGGGSGHEPAWAGYVGANMLTASVQGDIFASPSTRQILAAIKAVPSAMGTLLVVTNYTGDCLHFGLANEKANADGHRCRMILCGDDVSVGKAGGLVGRRGLAGQVAVLKAVGAAASAGGSLDDVHGLGLAVSQQTVSIAVTLDHCHVPGRAEHAMLRPDEVEIGTGPHNEPGYQRISPQPSPRELVSQALRYCLDTDDPIRGYVNFSKDDKAVLLISNFGGISHLELGALVHEVLEQLEHEWDITPVRVYAGFLETSLNAPAFSLSLINLTAASRDCKYSVAEIEAFCDARTDTAWESMSGSQASRRQRREQLIRKPYNAPPVTDEQLNSFLISPSVLHSMTSTACRDLLAAEPDLTKWDTIMGDGDCGETLKTGASLLLAALDSGLAEAGSVVKVLMELEDIVESKMGGTLGGILGIFFVSLRSAIDRHLDLLSHDDYSRIWGAALASAIASLRQYTPARVGDRTVMDTLIPFAQVLSKSGFQAAVDAAERGATSTKSMIPRLGRATYVAAGLKDDAELPPDPGAWGAMVVIKGLQRGMVDP